MIKILNPEIYQEAQESFNHTILDVGRLIMVNATRTTTIFGPMPVTTMVTAAVMLRVGTMTVDYLCDRVQPNSLNSSVGV